MGRNSGPVDGRHKKVQQQYDSNNKNASSNHNRFVVWSTWISYSYYSKDETFSSKLVDPGKRMGWSIEKRGHWNMAKSHQATIYHFCTEAYGRWKSITSLICDASEKAYATAINLKTLYEGKADVNLLFSKSRIAPKQKMSILRLKLLALLIGMRSLKFVSKELKLENTKIIVWTDSQFVLNWIKIKKPLSVFVRNRLTEITS